MTYTFPVPVSFPGVDWDVVPPESVGFSAKLLQKAQDWLSGRVDQYRFIVVHSGRIIFESYGGIKSQEKLGIASAAKSLYSSVLGAEEVAEDGFSASDEVFNYFPQMMEVPEGFGPKENRYAFEKDRSITFRQLISNTSGYMKPGEMPGKTFNYQTYGMNILTHALAAMHGFYDPQQPGSSIGFGNLIDRHIGDIIGSHWLYDYTNFDLHKNALLGVFGYYCQVYTTCRDFARAALLWNSGGKWKDIQLIPENWLREAISVAGDIRRNCPEEEFVYGMGFWTNEFGKLWPGLPKESFAACGAGGHYACCFPSHDVIVIQNPGPYHQSPEDRANPQLLELVLNAQS